MARPLIRNRAATGNTAPPVTVPPVPPVTAVPAVPPVEEAFDPPPLASSLLPPPDVDTIGLSTTSTRIEDARVAATERLDRLARARQARGLKPLFRFNVQIHDIDKKMLVSWPGASVTVKTDTITQARRFVEVWHQFMTLMREIGVERMAGVLRNISATLQ